MKDAAWVSSPIDAFILSRLEKGALKPRPRAGRQALIRRATFDLTGLPPTPEEVAAFESDDSPDAFAKVIDRLLASPRYGERWGRHWLDVARYSDTKGYVRLKDNPIYPSAWTFRDYVVRALNADLPYDQFVVQQLAADQLPLGDDPGPLAAMGFLTLGQRFINSQPDIIDDRIDVVTRGLLGLTVSCARCHDHKFDPIPTADYYGLYGVFASSLEPRVPPLVLPVAQQQPYAAYLTELRARTAGFDRFLEEQQAKLSAAFRARAGDYLLAGDKEPVQANFLPVMFLVDASKDLNPAMTQRWARLLEQTRKESHPVLAPWHALAGLAPDRFAAESASILAALNAPGDRGTRMNAVVTRALAAMPLPSLADAAQRYGDLFRQADDRWKQVLKDRPAATELAEPEWEEIRRLLYGPEAPCHVTLEDVEDFLFVDTTTQNLFHDQQRRVEEWIASPGAAPHAHVLVDAAVPTEPRIFVRGNASNPGEAVPRRFLEALSRGPRRPFERGSGRLDLARAIADRNNPLTARVVVNRVWMHHFGAGLVRTPGDFGLRGEPPTHPELLDSLASRFMDGGWSLKSLHRVIMLSAVYQQASDDDVHAREKDPENRLWWKMNRRRLDWEPLRDALLAVSGRLDLQMGGPGASLTAQPFSSRRTVYLLIDRQNLPGVLRTFDFPAPDASNPQRHQTTVPQQALFLMNGPFLKEQTLALARRPDLADIKRIEQRIDAAHRLLYGRGADAEEIALGLQFLEEEKPRAEAPAPPAGAAAPLTPWEEYVQLLLMANEFCFVD